MIVRVGKRKTSRLVHELRQLGGYVVTQLVAIQQQRLEVGELSKLCWDRPAVNVRGWM